MATIAPSKIDDVDEIRRAMAQIRREMHQDMRGVVTSAEVAFDWKHYARLYPFAALAAAAVVGYLIVPRKRKAPEVPTATEIAAALPVESKATAKKKERRAGLIGTLFGMVGPIVIRAAQSYAAQYVENWIAQQGVMGPSTATPGGGGPGFPGGFPGPGGAGPGGNPGRRPGP